MTDQFKFEQIALEDWRANFDLNLVGRRPAAVPGIRPRHGGARAGSIINIASVSARVPLSRVVAYSAAPIGLLPTLQGFRFATLWATDHWRQRMCDPLDVHLLKSRLYGKEALAFCPGTGQIPKEFGNPRVQIAEVDPATISD